MQLISREQHVDELMLLNFSEGFFENADGVAWLRGMMLENPHPQTPEAFARQLDASSRHNTLDRLGSLSMPTHVIGAEYDLLVPIWKSRELAERIPGAELTVIEGSPHGANIERAEEFNAAVLNFIAAQGGGHAGLGLLAAVYSLDSSATASSTVSWIGAARSNSTIWSTRDTGSPLRATTRSSCLRLLSRRTRPNIIATPLESMNSSSLKSTIRPRAALGTAAPIVSPVEGAPARSSSPVTCATTISPRVSMSSPTSSVKRALHCPRKRLRPACAKAAR